MNQPDWRNTSTVHSSCGGRVIFAQFFHASFRTVLDVGTVLDSSTRCFAHRRGDRKKKCIVSEITRNTNHEAFSCQVCFYLMVLLLWDPEVVLAYCHFRTVVST